ncbi:hypothetical protein [Streptomyces rubradiris]|uniref:hypothetical protein n=1 Tax=Streptomyces rubradiris TaxID=285531 RepID=UPI00167265E9|nr:hypothetical protein [Streptomyces rubradiris]GHG95493.1 membrane protein [Streptomyces rubradiris]
MTQHVLSLGAGTDPSLLLTLGIPGAATALALTGWAARRARRSQKRSSNKAVVAAALAALGCTAYSADTSWRFAADYLDVAGTAERAGMFAAAELGLFATALMARQNLTTQGTPGMPGTLVWVISGVQVIPAYAESGVVGGTVRAFVGPVMAGMLWHLAMGIELRLRTPGAASKGLVATLGREARERLLSRLGIATRDRDAAQITRDRATIRAVDLATRLADLSTEQRQSRRGRRLTRRLSKAIGRASVGTDPDQRAELLAQLAARRNALTLATVPLASPWSPGPTGEMATVVPAANRQSSPAPGGGPRTDTGETGGREQQAQQGPGSETAKQHEGSPPHHAGTDHGDRGPGTDHGDRGPGTDHGDREPGTDHGDRGPGTDHGDREPGTDHGDRGPGTDHGDRGPGTDHGDRGPGTDHGDREPGTDHGDREPGTDHGDRGPGTDHGDRGPGTDHGDREPGTDHGDRHSKHVRRSPASKGKGRAKRSGGSRGPQAQRPPRAPEEDVDQLVELIRPHVPALLDRDGNDTVTRVQLRKILRDQNLPGLRNDRMSLVLAALRNQNSTTARSTR